MRPRNRVVLARELICILADVVITEFFPCDDEEMMATRDAYIELVADDPLLRWAHNLTLRRRQFAERSRDRAGQPARRNLSKWKGRPKDLSPEQYELIEELIETIGPIVNESVTREGDERER